MTAVAEAIPRAARDHTFVLVGRDDGALVVALGGISATRDVREWWPAVAQPGGAIDLDRFRVLGVDYLAHAGVTTADQADAIAATLDELGLGPIHTLIGASYGGMVALALAERHPCLVEQLVVISAPARPHPMSVAMRSVQRQIVRLALDSGRESEGLSIARQLAVATYRSAEDFGARFDAESVQSYLRHQGDKFARRFTAQRFLALSESLDTHLVDASRIHTPATLVAARGDTIVPLEQMQELADTLSGPSILRITQTFTGHDAFLAEPQAAGAIIRNALLNPLA